MPATQTPRTPTPTNGYLLCASPRSGSTLLCDLLAQTGVAGRPQSYFRPASVGGLAREWGLSLHDGAWDLDFVDAVVRHGTADTGCFGLRIMWSDVAGTVARLRAVSGTDGSDADVLRELLGVRAFVHLARDDKVAEAVSLVLAEQTGLWHLHADGTERQRSAPPAMPRYDPVAISSALDVLEREAQGWTRWFRHVGVEPLRVTYEELVSDTARVLDRVVDHVGSGPPAPAAVTTAKLADERNERWVRRFRSE